jgi:nucleoside-diphosphate-sugar epimerase
MTNNIDSQAFQNKQVIVTGAAGFVGSHLCDQLIALGAKVIGVDNLLTGRQSNLAQLTNNPNFTLIKADVSSNPVSYLPADFKPDFIFHFASPASPPRYQEHPIETYLVNSLGTHQLLQYLYKNNPAGILLFASTSEIYGDPEIHPQTESYWGHVNPNGERSCYDEAKRLGETICGVHQRQFNLDVRIVRIFNTYGPRVNPIDGRVIPNFITQALAKQSLTIYGDGQQTRSYCFVSDLVTGILLMASVPQAKNETVNLGNPEEYTIQQTAEIINELTANSNLEFVNNDLPADDPTRRQPDINKAQQLLNWQPQFSFRQGLQKTIEYFQNHELPTG